MFVSATVFTYLISIVVSEGAHNVVCQRLEGSIYSLVHNSRAFRCYEIERQFLDNLIPLLTAEFVYKLGVLGLAISLCSNSVIWLMCVLSR